MQLTWLHDCRTKLIESEILKKLSNRQWLRQVWIQKSFSRKKRRPSARQNTGYTAQARAQFTSARSKLPAVHSSLLRRDECLSILPPENFSLTDNYEKTLAFIYDFKSHFSSRVRHLCDDGIRRRVYAEFSDISEIGPGAGLVLAAEIHRYSQTRAHKIRVHDEFWSENVRNYFFDTGLFELLNIDPRSIKTKDSKDPSRKTLQYMSGRTSSGKDAKTLMAHLQELSGQSVGSRATVYNAIAEALANVKHAYPDWFRCWPYRTSRRWWASGFWEPSSQTVGLQLYDQGAGIPATLPRQTYWPKLLRMLDPESSDAGLIAAAMEYGRTSTGQGGRGKGLSEMADWIEKSGTGFLKILSGRGEVTYRPGQKISRRNFNAPFLGTLVQWEISLAS